MKKNKTFPFSKTRSNLLLKSNNKIPNQTKSPHSFGLNSIAKTNLQHQNQRKQIQVLHISQGERPEILRNLRCSAQFRCNTDAKSGNGQSRRRSNFWLFRSVVTRNYQQRKLDVPTTSYASYVVLNKTGNQLITYKFSKIE